MIAGVVGLLRTLGSRGSVMDLRHEAGAEVPRTVDMTVGNRYMSITR
jgi:hypothetical protein